MKKAQFFLLCAVTILSFASCKKNDTAPRIQKTYLIKKTYTNIVENYYYDNQNRFSRMDYIEPGFTQYTTVSAYDANNNPTEYIVRTSGSTNVSKYNATYDAQSRPVTIEQRDSINPTTYTLRITMTFTYAGNKQTRSTFNHINSLTAVLEYLYGSDGNFQESKFTNIFGVHASSSVWSGYDNKNSFEPLLPHIVRSGMLPSKNNQTIESYTNVTTGVVTNYSATHVYNSDNYVTQTTYSGTTNPLVYNYTYEKR